MSVDRESSQKRSGTVLFADVAGFTAFAESIGEEAAFGMIRDVSSRMQEAIHDQNGTVGEFRGDGIMALFSVTSGLEDGPLRACQAALNIQRAIADAASDMTRRYGAAPKVRIGLHCGALVVGDVGDETSSHVTIIGDTANVASRLEGLAEPGQILISRDLFALVDGQVQADDLGVREVKGKAQPMRIYALRNVLRSVSRFEAARSRGLSTFYDRDIELAQLEDVLQQAVGRNLAMAAIEGEPGIGKSRLLHEFEKSLPLDQLRLVRGDCRADGGSVPFLPFADLLRGMLRLDAESSRDRTAKQVDALIAHTGLPAQTTRPHLMALLGKVGETGAVRGESAEMFGARIRQVIIELVEHGCRRQPLVLVLEDLHWADPGTLQIIERLLTLDHDLPLMLLGTFRPNFRPAWLMHPRVTRIAPKPISEASVSALIHEVMKRSNGTEQMAKLAIQKAEGNPLYAEEIAKFLADRDVTAGPRNNTEIVLPTNLQNMVMARFDRLATPCRRLLQAASAIGRRFDAAIAHEIVGGEAPFDDMLLEEAVDAEVIRTSDNGYQFKHALVQDAIYDTLLRGQRRELHGRIAAALEARFANRTEETAEALAYHFDQAEMPEKAVPHLIAAGQRNLTVFSLDGAETAFARAYALIREHDLNPESELVAGLYAGWFEVQQWRAEFGRTVAIFEGEEATIQAAADTVDYPRILALAGLAYVQRKEFETAERAFETAIAISEKRDNRDGIIHACLGMMAHHCSRPRRGSWEQVQLLAERINGLLGDEAQPYFRTYCSFYENWSHSIRGDIDIALVNGKQLFKMGKSMNFSGAVGWGAICVAFNEAYSENYSAAIEYASMGAEAAGGFVDQMVSLGLKGLAMVLNGDAEGGGKLLQEVKDRGEALDYLGIENIVDGPIGLAKALSGNLGGGVDWLRGAIVRAEAGGNAHGAAMTHISLGQLYLMLATGSDRPDLRTFTRNAVFLLREAPFAKSRALKHFETAIEVGEEVGMHGVVAQAQHGKAMALKASKKLEAARKALQDAETAIGKVEWKMMRERIHSDLKALRTSA